MTRRGKIRLGVYAAALLLTLCGLWGSARLMLGSSSAQLEYGYRRALGDLTDYVTGMRDTLRKAPYAGTPQMQNQVSAELLEQSGGAKAAMAALPLSQEKAERISRFLSQTGDYALYLSRRSAAGREPDENRPEVLGTLGEYAGKLSDALTLAQARLDTEQLRIGRVRSLLENVELPEELPVLDEDLDEVAQAFAEFPSLLYDGPFSDHINQRTPLFLEGEREIDQDEAARRAAEFLDCSPDELTAVGEGGDRLPVYCFAGPSSRVNISRQGGRVVYYKKSGAVNSAVLSEEQAVKKAAETLVRLGVTDFRESYAVLNDNLCTVNFAGVCPLGEQQVTCYPDLVKVTVELEQGGTVEVDATGYLMNCRERALESPSLSVEEAAEKLSPLLTVEESGLALVPTPGLDEVLCWEFLCRAQGGPEGGDEFLVYINGDTGMEEQLFLLRRDEHGTLVI